MASILNQLKRKSKKEKEKEQEQEKLESINPDIITMIYESIIAMTNTDLVYRDMGKILINKFVKTLDLYSNDGNLLASAYLANIYYDKEGKIKQLFATVNRLKAFEYYEKVLNYPEFSKNVDSEIPIQYYYDSIIKYKGYDANLLSLIKKLEEVSGKTNQSISPIIQKLKEATEEKLKYEYAPFGNEFRKAEIDFNEHKN